ncbi:MAG: ATP-binding protein [bacterium]|nr:ATP-binding protein [bacterium]
MKKLPIGIQTFSDLIGENYLYVDKTKEIHNLLIQGGKYCFLSRPRRFGKSLLVSTLKEIFTGNKELFKGLWIHDKISWEKHPVIHLDFLGLKYGNKEELTGTLEYLLRRNADSYGITLQEKGYDRRFKELITELSKINKVVVLVDEYDKPIIDFIEQPQTAINNRNTLRTFFETLKEAGSAIKFVFITGVSKFSKVSIFSGLNNLDDITMDDRFAGILGYTGAEVSHYFGDALKQLAGEWGVSEEQLKEKVRRWYNGYSWDGSTKLYNPISLHYFIDKRSFSNYWFATATPSFLVRLIREKEIPVSGFDGIAMDATEFDGHDVEHIALTPLLFQTGYLTVSKTETDFGERTYYLSYPNREVRESFLKHLFRDYLKREAAISSAMLKKLKKALFDDDLELFFKSMSNIFASLPFDMMVKDREGYYQTVIYLILKLIGLETDTEVETNHGRLDAVIETDNFVYVMEYKMGTAERALAQIMEKKYYQKYEASGKTLVAVGVGFDMKERNLNGYKQNRL